MPPKKKTNRNGVSKTNGQAQTTRLTTSARPAPISIVSSNQRPNQQNVTKLSGSDFITALTVQPNPRSTESRILASFPISPSAYPGTRLSSLSNLWERFRFTQATLRYVPAVPMTLACQLIVYIDTDPLDDPLNIKGEAELIRQATAQAKSQQFNFNTPKNISLVMRKDDQMYYTGIDKQNLRFSQQGTAYIIQITECVNFNGETIPKAITAGSIYLDWNVCLSTPQINPSALTCPPEEEDTKNLFQANTIYSPLFTLNPNSTYIFVLDVSFFEVNPAVDNAIVWTSDRAITDDEIRFEANSLGVDVSGVVVATTGNDGKVQLNASANISIDLTGTINVTAYRLTC